MGCSESKLEQQRAVVLCRGRVELLATAIRHREVLAASHTAYSDSLLSVSAALHRILLPVPASCSSPVLPLPARRKTAPSPPPSPPPPPVVSSARYTRLGSHVNFASSDSDSDSDSDDNDDDEEDEDFPLCSPGIVTSHHFHHYGTIPGGPGFGNIYYARSQPPPPSISVEQRQASQGTVQITSFDSYAAAAAYPSYGYPFASFPGYYEPMGELFGPSSAPQAMPSPMATAASAFGRASSSRAPPPPPSPPNTSTWDFLNPFNNIYNSYYHHYTPSRSSGEVREEEGIPELEEIDQEEEKEAYGRQNCGTSSVRDGSYHRHSRAVAPDQRSKVEPEAIDNDLTTAEEFKRTQIGQRNSSEVADTIQMQFQKASQCFAELSELLEVDNYWQRSRHSPSDDGYKVIDSGGLASTLQKLHVWERKLRHEVRAEEKMRLLLRKSHKELKHLLEKGAEEHKIESTRNLIDKLSTKIRIAIRVVSSVSRKINLVRDEELWPRITELVLGFVRVWNVMLQCHQVQSCLMAEAKSLDLVISGDHADEVMQLEMEMLKWSSNLSAWINAQRNCVKALNGWLLLCLHGEAGPAASEASPRRLGAPPVFIICNSWSQAIDRTSENAVLDAMQDFAAALHRLWGQQMTDQTERTAAAVRDRERLLRATEKKSREMRKEASSLSRKLAVVPARFRLPLAAGHHHAVLEEGRRAAGFSSSLQLGLEKVFEAMEGFSAGSVKAYQELLQHCGHHHRTD